MKKNENVHFGGLAPNLTPELHVPWNLSRARRGTHDPEKKSDIARTVAEKIEFEKNLCRPLAAKPEVGMVT